MPGEIGRGVDGVAVAQTMTAIAQGVITGRGVWIKTPGQLNFKDTKGVTQNLDSGYFLAGLQYGFGISEILSGTTAVGFVLV